MPHRLSPVAYELTFAEENELSWEVTRVRVEEMLSRPYCATVEALTRTEDPELDALLGVSASLSLTRGLGAGRLVCGIVTRIDYVGVTHHCPLVRFTLEPAFALLAQRVRSRIWQQHSVLDIVAEVLHAELPVYGRDHDLGSVQRARIPRDYCVQYRESDLAFVSRLLEEEGISYTFTHDPSTRVERLTLRDANGQYQRLRNVDETAEVPVLLANPSEADTESIQRLEWSTQLTSTAALRRDYDWHTPRRLLSETAPGRDARGREREVYTHGVRRLIDDDLSELVADTRDVELVNGRLARGHGNVSSMRPGLRMLVHGHERHALDQEYLLTRVVHTGSEVPTASGAEARAEPHVCEFTCVPFDTLVRPAPRTPAPREYGPQTALVVGPPGEEIHTDEAGRVQVQFYWERSPSYAAEASCWVRCAQSWAGMAWGAQFIPRVGMEVVVEFLEGNPDRPLVTGCVYNGDHPPPFPLPEHKTRSGWRTQSSPGGQGHNELHFEDATGHEEIYLHGEKDWRIRIKHDKDQRIEHDERLEVRNDRRKLIARDEAVEVGRDRKEIVDHDQRLEVGNDQQLKVGRDDASEVGRNRIQTVAEADRLEVGTTLELSVGERFAGTIGDKAELEIAKDFELEVGGNASEKVSGDKLVDAHALELRSVADSSLASGARLLITAVDDVELEGEAKILVKAATRMVFECGQASITLSEDGTIRIEGKDISVKGSGTVALEGQQVTEN